VTSIAWLQHSSADASTKCYSTGTTLLGTVSGVTSTVQKDEMSTFTNTRCYKTAATRANTGTKWTLANGTESNCADGNTRCLTNNVSAPLLVTKANCEKACLADALCIAFEWKNDATG